jgi:hypothetical protein
MRLLFRGRRIRENAMDAVLNTLFRAVTSAPTSHISKPAFRVSPDFRKLGSHRLDDVGMFSGDPC